LYILASQMIFPYRIFILYANKSYVNRIWKVLLVNISVKLETANQQSIKFSPRDKFRRKPRGYGISMFHLFVEFQPVYNTVSRNILPKALKEFKISQRLIRMDKLTLRHVRCGVKIQYILSEQLKISQC
jgi:hypothetical protein